MEILIERYGDRIRIFSPFSENELTKTVPGTKWDDGKTSGVKSWWIPLSWAGCVQCRATWDQSLRVGPQLAEWARAERDHRVDPCLELRAATDAQGEMLQQLQKNGEGTNAQLYPFQRAGVAFLSTARHALLADEMGVGKSCQAIVTLEITDAYPALCVVPNSVKRTWVDEFAKWAPERRVVMIEGGLKQKRESIAQVRDGLADVAVINWEALWRHSRVAGWGSRNLSEKDKTEKELNEVTWSSVVADECHHAKSPHAQQTRALWWLGDHLPEDGVRLALTGTPVANTPEDLWAIMRFVVPKEFPAKTAFIDRYGLKAWSAWGYLIIAGLLPERKEELFKILDPRMIRRTKAAVLPQLPEKTYSTRYVKMLPKQAKAYEQIRKQMVAELEEGTLIASNPLVKLTRLLQFASAYGEINDRDALVLTDPSCKVDALVDIVEELGEQHAVVFAESRQLIEIAHSRLLKASGDMKMTKEGPEFGSLYGIKIAMLTGATSPTEREFNKTAFNEGKLNVLLITLGAGGEGLSLSGASIEIFLQRTFNAVKNSQAEDRLHGIGRGQEGQPLQIIDIIAEGTAEARVHQVLREKADRLEEVVRDREILKTWLAKEEK